jgi:predicted DNA-binding transcriptional regulator AlpA
VVTEHRYFEEMIVTRTILRPDEVSALTGVAEETLKYWRPRGKGPRWYKLGRRVVYDLAAVEEWLDEQRATGAA